jgi:hypothetical protein
MFALPTDILTVIKVLKWQMEKCWELVNTVERRIGKLVTEETDKIVD